MYTLMYTKKHYIKKYIQYYVLQNNIQWVVVSYTIRLLICNMMLNQFNFTPHSAFIKNDTQRIKYLHLGRTTKRLHKKIYTNLFKNIHTTISKSSLEYRLHQKAPRLYDIV